jgi:hypothetical protein
MNKDAVHPSTTDSSTMAVDEDLYVPLARPPTSTDTTTPNPF